jgi:hypothetical protein
MFKGLIRRAESPLYCSSPSPLTPRKERGIRGVRWTKILPSQGRGIKGEGNYSGDKPEVTQGGRVGID